MLLIVTAFAYWQLYLPRQQELQGLAAEASRLEAEVLGLQALPAPQPVSTAEWAALTARVPAGREEARLVKALQAASSKTGVKLELLTLKPEDEGQQRPAGPLLPLQLSLTVKGTYGQTEAFLREITSLQRLLRVDSWSLQAAEQPRVLTLQATAFYTELAPVPRLPAPSAEKPNERADPTQ